MEGIVGQFTAERLFPRFRDRGGGKLTREALCIGTDQFQIWFQNTTGFLKTLVLISLQGDRVCVRAGQVKDTFMQAELDIMCAPEKTFTAALDAFELSTLQSKDGVDFLSYMTLVEKEMLVALVLTGMGNRIEIKGIAGANGVVSFKLKIVFDRGLDDVVKLTVNIGSVDAVYFASVTNAVGYIKVVPVGRKTTDGEQFLTVEEFRKFILRCRHDSKFNSLIKLEQRLDRLLSSC